MLKELQGKNQQKEVEKAGMCTGRGLDWVIRRGWRTQKHRRGPDSQAEGREGGDGEMTPSCLEALDFMSSPYFFLT